MKMMLWVLQYFVSRLYICSSLQHRAQHRPQNCLRYRARMYTFYCIKLRVLTLSVAWLVRMEINRCSPSTTKQSRLKWFIPVLHFPEPLNFTTSFLAHHDGLVPVLASCVKLTSNISILVLSTSILFPSQLYRGPNTPYFCHSIAFYTKSST